MPKVKRSAQSKHKAARKVKYLPYARGFQPPTSKDQLKAIGQDNMIKQEYIPDAKIFPPIPKCTSIDDWLAQYNEEGQTFHQFLQECPWLSTRKRKTITQKFNANDKTILEKYPEGKIYIVPFGEFTGDASPHFEALREYAEIFLGIPVQAMPPIKLNFKDHQIYWEPPADFPKRSNRTTKYKLNSRWDKESGRHQLCIDTALLKLRSIIPKDALCMIGLTMSDLYCDKSDLFVAGMAAGGDRVAIFSFYRYNPNMSFSTEFWHDVEWTRVLGDTESQRLVLLRSCKLLVHEICHLLGIDHCIYYSCCMNGSGHLQEDFDQPMFMCPVDLHKLQHLVGFDVLERYRKMLSFFTKHEMQDEAEWLKRRIEFIQQGRGPI